MQIYPEVDDRVIHLWQNRHWQYFGRALVGKMSGAHESPASPEEDVQAYWVQIELIGHYDLLEYY